MFCGKPLRIFKQRHNIRLMILEENSSEKVRGDWNKEVSHYAIAIVQVNDKAP